MEIQDCWRYGSHTSKIIIMAGFIRKLKQSWRRKRLSLHDINEARSVEQLTVGSGGGAWVVSPKSLGEDSIVYSFGAGTDISFDLEMQAKFNCHVHIFDPTPRSVQWIGQQSLPERIWFHPCGIGNQDGSIVFFPPKRKTSSHFSPVPRYRNSTDRAGVEAPVKRLGSFLTELDHDRIDVLKIDIEGGEYDILEDVLSTNVEIDQLLLEFHHAYSTIPLRRTIEAVKRIQLAGFELFHLSQRTYEMSFIHRRVTI
ncbi:MAG: FkbM family methyltransferase [Parasphingorhabdus sp.]